MKPLLEMLESARQCDEVLSCLFGLNSLETEIYFFLLGKEMDIKTLASVVERERSVVYRSLQKLIYSNLCRKKKKVFPRGGYYFVYSSVEPEKVKEFILKKLKRMEEHLQMVLGEFEEKVRERKELFKRKKEL